jgi:uncharacterized Ntn-hydrolase superfamily protein
MRHRKVELFIKGIPLSKCELRMIDDSSPINRLAHTYSIIAIDPETGEMGGAVQSHWFSVGTAVLWAEAGVGVVATQALTNISYGPRGLELMKGGMTAKEVVSRLTEEDGSRETRQLAVLSVDGGIEAWTGRRCIKHAGHIVGDNFSVQANMMLKDTVWPAMAKAFTAVKGPLAERLLAALDAAEAAGGDIRGRQSAAVLIVRTDATGNVWEDRTVDLRADDCSDPLAELRRLLKVKMAYDHMNEGDTEIEKGDMAKALFHYSSAESMVPENEEMMFWHAVTLANKGHYGDAKHLFDAVFEKNENWRELAKRLVPAGMLKVTEEQLGKMLEDKPRQCNFK